MKETVISLFLVLLLIAGMLCGITTQQQLIFILFCLSVFLGVFIRKSR